MSNAKNKHRNIRKGGHVKTVRYHDLLRAKRTQNPLSGLNPAKVRRLYELYREGKYADVQLAWDALEEYDDMLGTVLNRRQSALGEMEWDVLIDARAVGEDAALQALAEEQQDFITRRLRAVENLSDAIKWLGLADFRRYSALEVLTAGSGERWLPIHHWLLCRPALEGAWCYNENAETSCTRVEPIDMSAVLLREVARPIDLVAMFLISAKEAAIDGWDSFLEVFGNPALFFKMPPGTSDDQRDEYASIIKEISSDGAGVYPDGGEIHTVETSAANADAFSSRAEWCDKALVRRATGGLLTVLAESGSGTLAGSAHMEAFRQIAANDAISIAECINRQYVRRRIAAEFPGEPVLVYFTLTQPMINDRAATVNMLCQLAGQRWRATDEAVSEEVGVEVHTEPQPGAVPSAEQKQIITNACNQYSHAPGCPDAEGGSAGTQAADPDDTPDEMPEDADEELQERYMEASSMASAGADREEIYAVTGVDVGKTELDREYEAMVAAGADDAAIYKQTGIRRADYEQRRQKRRLSKHPRRVDQGANAAFERRKAQRAREAAQEALLTNTADSPPQPHSQIDTTAEPPLNDGELAALRALGAELNPAQIAADADYMTREMMAGLRKPVTKETITNSAEEHDCEAVKEPCPLQVSSLTGKETREKIKNLAPVEIGYSEEKRTGAQWAEEAKSYFLEHFAGRQMTIGKTDYMLHIPNSENKAKQATFGVNTQKRTESLKNLQGVIDNAVHLKSEDAKNKPAQSKKKQALLARTATFETFGYPATINGEKNLIWFNAITKKHGDRDVLFYEFGCTPIDKD